MTPAAHPMTRRVIRQARWTIPLLSIALITSPARADEIVETGVVLTKSHEDGSRGESPGDVGSSGKGESPILPRRQETLEQRLAQALDVCIGARDYCRADRDWWVDRSVALEEICLHPETPNRTPDWGLILGGAGVGVAVGVIATVVVYEVTK